ncbi:MULTISPECIES: DUF5681 domain-containing protein [unclassified Mesorhizobium]|uniref:DUF5681 domain-containing protein n=2 Tax=Mesorhizobium TaxID=68287 RepID=UPI0003CDE170|nr:DUF5681 domain-containing protein [Mesorhizobium sp. LNJC391B00]ESY27706.1 hypothetical protein X749_22005 [Mesorhizobium sp. LNJC391B00]
MTTRRKKSADYSIGYGKPPAETRFQKGMSGNPKGRPKGKKNMNTIVRETLFGPIQIQQNGRTTTVTALEAILLKMRNNALSGDFRSAAHALQLASRCAELEESRQPDAEVDVFDPQTMVEMMRDYLDHKDSSENDTETPSKTGDQGDEE